MKTSLLKERLEIYAPAGIKSLFGERMFKDRGIVLRQIHMRKSVSPFFVCKSDNFMVFCLQKWPVLPGDILPNSASTPRADFFDVYEDARIKVSAGHILHSIFCVGYVIEEKLSHAVDIDALQAAFPHIDRSRLGNLYGGKDAECDGVRIEHKRFAKPRSGRKIGKALLLFVCVFMAARCIDQLFSEIRVMLRASKQSSIVPISWCTKQRAKITI